MIACNFPVRVPAVPLQSDAREIALYSPEPRYAIMELLASPLDRSAPTATETETALSLAALVSGVMAKPVKEGRRRARHRTESDADRAVGPRSDQHGIDCPLSEERRHLAARNDKSCSSDACDCISGFGNTAWGSIDYFHDIFMPPQDPCCSLCHGVSVMPLNWWKRYLRPHLGRIWFR